ncbi:MAG TPA: hypothetical protein VK559_04405 [Ferruginibacter sp.]|nr:hypothetical protein [Ferruginibacter sp.]
MRKIYFIVFIITSITIQNTWAQAASGNRIFSEDTVLHFHERFVLSLLDEYDQPGRWLFLNIDSCAEKNWHEVVNPVELINNYAVTFKGLSRYNILFEVGESFIIEADNHREDFWSSGDPCRADTLYGTNSSPYYVKGIKINMEVYNKLHKQPVGQILHTYFDSHGNFKKEYSSILYELVAVCYVNNIKVITYSNGDATYTIFK